MTKRQALKEAVRRWGKTACIEDRGKSIVLTNGAILHGRFTVGRVELGMFFCIKGEGASWEHAFAMSTWNL